MKKSSVDAPYTELNCFLFTDYQCHFRSLAQFIVHSSQLLTNSLNSNHAALAATFILTNLTGRLEAFSVSLLWRSPKQRY
ncbi:MAG: hypothetical protein V7K21_16645 [Nostoc sp.]|uniref:hypothetical protein n=1 Tax=Nostoc sp. TaxID=1180 RepID=UPI002FF50353